MKNTILPSKNFVWRLKRIFLRKMSYFKKYVIKIDYLIKFLDGSAWLCMEKLKKYSFETKNVK